jgi:hypothetical protein
MKRFPWGSVIQQFDYDFDGERLDVVKFHPWRSEDGQVLGATPNESEVMFHNEELQESFDTLHGLLIAWVVYKRLGDDDRSLAQGIIRALDIKPEKCGAALDGAAAHVADRAG